METIEYKHAGDIPPDKMRSREDLRLVKAAIRCGDKVYTGWRHAAIMIDMRDAGIASYVSQDDQGFVDQDGYFYRRQCCGYIAFRNGQTKELKPNLLSEHLWDVDGTPGDFSEKPIDNKESDKKAAIEKVGRNDPCPCGSGKKFKKCCLGK